MKKYTRNIHKLIDKSYYTVSETAYILGVSPLTIRNWDKAGKLRARRNPLNNYRVYKRSDIEYLINRMESGRISRDVI